MDLASRMRGYWSSFAAAGDPTGSAVVAWPAFDRAREQILTLDDLTLSGQAVADGACDFWDSISAAASPR
jgi:carboxylesterase type B